MNIIGIVPARMASSRFPGKPMVEICGIPMVGHVYYRAKMSELLDEVYVATCDKEIYDYIISIGGKAVMTADTHERCGDRVAEALTIIEKETAAKQDIIVLLQGDEPLINPEMIDDATRPLMEDKNILISNLVGNIKLEEEWKDPNTVKTVVAPDGNAIYFSREPIPSNKKWDGEIPMKKQICIIPHQRDFLLKFNELEPTPLEKIESIDMLRVIEHGYKVKMIPTPYNVQAVDTPQDLEKVNKIMDADPLLSRYK
jgi:3-deoxy-manno-octulosonate cytidylyltransferase (CMP-KDO synthetase)